ncbi:MAG: hypothetical protein AB7K04_01755 [Pseudorhodoplanes sp.]
MRPISPAVAGAVVLALGVPAGAQDAPPAGADTYRGSPEQRAACTGDVFRYCAWYIPNVDNIVSCLRAKKPKLSPACRLVFEGGTPGNPAQNAAPARGRVQTEGAGNSSWW